MVAQEGATRLCERCRRERVSGCCCCDESGLCCFGMELIRFLHSWTALHTAASFNHPEVRNNMSIVYFCYVVDGVYVFLQVCEALMLNSRLDVVDRS